MSESRALARAGGRAMDLSVPAASREVEIGGPGWKDGPKPARRKPWSRTRFRRLFLLLLLMSASFVYWAVEFHYPFPPAPSEPRDPRDYPDTIKVQRNVVFGQGGGRDLHMNLHFSRRRQGLRRAILYFHGGGWEKGSHNGGAPVFDDLVRRGFVVASVEYRLSGEAPFPAALEDAKCAVRFLRAKQKTVGVDARSLGAFGNSSGGHLALLLAVTGGESEWEGQGGWPDESSRIQAAAGLSSLVDLAWTPEGTPPAHNIQAFLGGAPALLAERYLQASPQSHATADDPPVLLLHSDSDRGVPLHHPQVLQESLQAVGAEAEVRVYPGAHHDLRQFQDEADRELVAFFSRTLGAPLGNQGWGLLQSQGWEGLGKLISRGG